MTKQEAIRAMKEGKKVQHMYFTPDEWMKETNDRSRLGDTNNMS